MTRLVNESKDTFEQITLLQPVTDIGEEAKIPKTNRCDRRWLDTTTKGASVPVWLKIGSSRAKAVERHLADHVLIDVSTESRPLDGTHSMTWAYPGAIRARTIKIGKLYATYVNTYFNISGTSPTLKLRLSASFSKVEDYCWNSNDTRLTVCRIFEADDKIFLKAIRSFNGKPEVGEFPRSKVSGEHHTHLRPEEVWKASQREGVDKRRKVLMSAILSHLRQIDGMTEACVATFLVYAFTAHPEAVYLLASSNAIWGTRADIEVLADRLKAVATPMKTLHRSDWVDLTELFELQVLVNRGVGAVNWKKERQHREHPDVVKVDPVKVYNSARQIFASSRSRGFVYPRMTWNEYLNARWEWAPSGSVHSSDAEDKQYISQDRLWRQKFVTLSKMKKSYITRFLYGPRKIEAWKSTKYEWSKQRAIYGTDLRSMVVTNFAMYRCEDVLTHRFPVGRDAEERRVAKRVAGMLSDAEPFCYDFDDFNAQHSIPSMHAVLCAYRDEFSKEMTIQQADAAQWVVDSISNMRVIDGERSYKLAGTLLSGWRLTTFMNTILNYIYFEIAGVFDNSGVRDSVHNGDDVMFAVTDMRACTDIVHRMNIINARAQAVKCNVFSLGEFLRVDRTAMNARKGIGKQYVTRACATLVHSRVESNAPVKLTGAVAAAETRLGELSDRGGGVVEVSALRAEIYRNLERIFAIDPGIPELIARTSVVTGGVNTHKFASVENIISEQSTAAVSEVGETVADLHPGIEDYSKYLDRLVGGGVDKKRIYGTVKRATNEMLSFNRSSKVSVRVDHDNYKARFERALLGRDRDLVKINNVSRARFLGVPPHMVLSGKELHRLRSRVGDVSDPLRAIAILC